MPGPKDSSEEIITHEAEVFLNKLWNKLYARVRELLSHHHRNHEPGGIDALVLNLTELHDVYATSPDDHDALIWNEVNKHWESGSVGAYDLYLNDLLDVDTGGPITGHVLTYNTVLEQWINLPIKDVAAVGLHLDDLLDVDAAGPMQGDVISWNSTSSMWETGAKMLTLDGLTDVDAANPALGDLIVWNDVTELWEHKPAKDALGLGPGLHLDDLIDVDATAPVTGDTIVYNAVNEMWEHKAGGSGSKHQAYLLLSLPITVVPPGPINLSDSTRSITVLNCISDGKVSGYCTGGGFSFGTIGGESNSSCSVSWTPGMRLGVTIDEPQSTSATYLILEWLFS